MVMMYSEICPFKYITSSLLNFPKISFVDMIAELDPAEGGTNIVTVGGVGHWKWGAWIVKYWIKLDTGSWPHDRIQ